ncbi:hypothetical protein J132_01946 [Termitomyces sp. J132]|nr:hypothetical protein H2248_000245 [Termitomyces sp. 'cryptogamus']KNZ72742.1 hypothetical protein J132_01946 [Termitomyces sp. J132]
MNFKEVWKEERVAQSRPIVSRSKKTKKELEGEKMRARGRITPHGSKLANFTPRFGGTVDDITMDLMNAADLAHGDTNRDTLSTPPGLVKAMAPSPESDNPNSHFSNFDPPSSTMAPYQKARSVGPDARATIAPSPPELRINRHSQTKRSTRIPDFVEILHLDGDHLISTVLLIVEIKKEPPLPHSSLFLIPLCPRSNKAAFD